MFFRRKIQMDSAISQKAKERDFFLKNFQHYVRRFNKIVIFIHERPDGDCLGGGSGMKEVFQTQFRDKSIYLVGSAQGVFPWLKMDFDELPEDFDFSSAMALVVDVTIGDRTQKFNEFFKNLGTRRWGAVVRVDHHDVKTDFYTDLSWVDGSYAACCCQLLQICDYYQWTINKKAATFFYLGILTDSGFFSNGEVSPRTLVLGAKALRYGADREFLINNLRRVTVTGLKLRAKIMLNYNQDEKFAWYLLDKATVEEFAPYSTSNALVTTLANIEDNILWILFTEEAEDTIIVSFRSLGAFDVRHLAEEFGGGGHLNAAGTTLHNISQVQEVVDRSRQLVKEFIENGGVMSRDAERNKLKEDFDDSVFPPYTMDLDEEQQETLEDSQELVDAAHKETSSKEFDINSSEAAEGSDEISNDEMMKMMEDLNDVSDEEIHEMEEEGEEEKS